jgi:CO dehydrogenase/acetyl-CoA synthase delta subunit
LPHHDKKKDENPGLTLSQDLLEALAKFQEIELENFELNAKELELWFEPGMAERMIPQLAKAPAAAAKGKPTELLTASFTPPIETYPGKITEVRLGATRGEGGRSLLAGRLRLLSTRLSIPWYIRPWSRWTFSTWKFPCLKR